jgi:HlyD family secretion protein
MTLPIVQKLSREVPATPFQETGGRWSAHIRSVAGRLWLWRWYVLGAIAALGAALYYGPTLIFGPQVTGDVAVRADFLQTVVASGHVEAPFRVDIGSQITGIVTDIPVKEGQTVKTGATLIVLDDHELQAAVGQAEGVVSQAEARIRQMTELTLPSADQTLKDKQATLLNAQKLFGRITRLVSDGFSTRAALDDATKTLDSAKAQVRSAELAVATAKPGGSDFVMVQTEMDQARASLGTAKSRLGYATITAPRDGVLISRAIEQGGVVQPGKVLMTLSPAGETQIVVQIDEKSLGLIAVGQKALVSADAFAKQSFPATVVFVNPGIDLQRASIEVKLLVPDPPSYLRQDMTVSVDIEIARRPNAVVLPAGSLRDLATGKPWVLEIVAGQAKRRAVEAGIVSGGKAEIASGLAGGEFIVPASNTAIKDGQRVRAAPDAAIEVKASTALQRPGTEP